MTILTSGRGLRLIIDRLNTTYTHPMDDNTGPCYQYVFLMASVIVGHFLIYRPWKRQFNVWSRNTSSVHAVHSVPAVLELFGHKHPVSCLAGTVMVDPSRVSQECLDPVWLS